MAGSGYDHHILYTTPSDHRAVATPQQGQFPGPVTPAGHLRISYHGSLWTDRSNPYVSHHILLRRHPRLHKRRSRQIQLLRLLSIASTGYLLPIWTIYLTLHFAAPNHSKFGVGRCKRFMKSFSTSASKSNGIWLSPPNGT